ncbi:MAG: YopX family protein [bacterium]|nr:YopX family protein [bacterium]
MKTQQRILKFRAWDIKTKKFIATDFHILGEVMCFGLIEQYIDENMCGAENSLDRWNDIVITQFTGLQDKNKKDIYEGDIVKGYDKDYQPKSEKFSYIGEITYENSYFCLSPFKLFILSDLDILGNIFENPNLLDKDNDCYDKYFKHKNDN